MPVSHPGGAVQWSGGLLIRAGEPGRHEVVESWYSLLLILAILLTLYLYL